VRVLFSTYPWAFETPGGGEIQLRKYAEYLPHHGVDVRLHDSWQPNLADVSLCHFFSCIGGSVHYCKYIKRSGLPLVISASLWITAETRHLYPSDEIRAQLELADIIVTNSGAESDQIAEVLALPRDRFASVMNGFEPRFVKAADSGLFRGAFNLDGPFILNVGNIEPRKNQLALVRALKGLALPLVLIGHQRDPAYAAEVLAEGGPQVRYLGPLAHDDPRLSSAFAACSAFVLPSTLETPGLAALEAAALGAAVVVTSEGSTREYFADHVHYVDHRSPADIRRGIDTALTRGPDPHLKQHVTSRLSWPEVTRALVPIYRNAIQLHDKQAGGLHPTVTANR
jgi:glycosyltransferase involved in cell wall biosynthesis